jgi:FixJ family two-component response regulator
VLFLSGRADVPKAVKAVREGAIDFIEKPFDYSASWRWSRSASRATPRRAAPRSKRAVCERARAAHAARARGARPRGGRPMNREIAEKLDISIKTVEAHRAKIMEKLEVDSVAELVQATSAARVRVSP